MAAILSTRQKNWLEGLGAHIATASLAGVPQVIVVDTARIDGDSAVKFPISEAQKTLIAANVKVA